LFGKIRRRDLTDGTKREAVKQALLEHPERVAEDTQADIAADLGVARSTVAYAADELRESGKLVNVDELSTEEKRAEVRAYVEANPAASDREVAERSRLANNAFRPPNTLNFDEQSRPFTRYNPYTQPERGEGRVREIP
jgi:DNA-binding MurR/RpiR family transcriptional regulator